MGYYLPFGPEIKLGQTFGSNPGWGPNPAGGHNGDDWLTPVGVPVRAAGDGYVLFAGQYDDTYEDNFGWGLNYGGNQVVLNLDGQTGPYVEYGHLSVMYVKSGERVSAGQIIALTGATDGNTGVITGPHCHVGVLPWNYSLNTSTYGRVNPRLYLTDYWQGQSGSLSAQSATISAPATTQEWDEMASKEDLKQAIREVNAEPYGTVDSIRYMPINGWNGAVSLEARVLGTDKAVNDLLGKIAGLEELVRQLSVKQGVVIDTKAIAKAVNDDAAKRLGA
jgi:murein DD-endopeptidase MepM/ murein hydrolase activator NlpD